MFGDGHSDSIVQRGLDEALACQDMLERTPARPSLLTRAILRIGSAIRSIVHRDSLGKQRGIPAAPRRT
jgi:hypothetical protein